MILSQKKKKEKKKKQKQKPKKLCKNFQNLQKTNSFLLKLQANNHQNKSKAKRETNHSLFSDESI